MQSFVATVSGKGRIKLPAKLRRQLGIERNSQVVLTLDGDVATIRRAEWTLEDVIGSLPALPAGAPTDWDEQRRIAWEEAVAERMRRLQSE
jgi:AbrB family looped-hinge helix DNA binding protein